MGGVDQQLAEDASIFFQRVHQCSNPLEDEFRIESREGTSLDDFKQSSMTDAPSFHASEEVLCPFPLAGTKFSPYHRFPSRGLNRTPSELMYENEETDAHLTIHWTIIVTSNFHFSFI